jgi:N-acetylmuramoyl-L-alanine amidase
MKKRKNIKHKYFTVMAVICFISSLVVMSQVAYGQEKILIYNNQEHRYNVGEVKLRIDQNLINYNGMYPVIIEDRTLVPIREVMESPQIGATVDFKSSKEPIRIQKGDMIIEITLGSKIAKINGIDTALDVPAMLIRDKAVGIDKTMVPIRFITEALGYKVDWDNYNREVVLTSNEKELFELTTTESNVTRLKLSSTASPLPTYLNNNPIFLSVPTQENFFQMEEYMSAASFPDTEIVEIVGNISETRFYIRSTTSMSNISYTYWDDKVIVDIEGLVMGSFPTVIRMDNGVYSYRVRTSQYSENPKKGRVVFDLYDNAVPREIIISSDRTQLELIFNEVGLSNLTVTQDQTSDYLMLKGKYSNVNLLRLESPNRMIIDLKNTVNLLGQKSQNFINGQEIQSIRIGQFDYETTRIVVETINMCDFVFNYDEVSDTTQIRVIPSNFQQVEYEKVTNDSITTEVLTIPLLSYLPELITLEEDLSTFTTKIIFPTVIPELSKEESVFIGDGYIDTLSVKVVDGKSVLSIKGSHILEFSIEQREQGMTFVGKRPKDLYEKIVLIDIGHGGNDPGASHNGIIEKEVNLKIGLYLKSFIAYDSRVKYYFTRESDVGLSLQNRVDIANDLEVDFMLSIHNNAIDIVKDPSKVLVKGMEILTTIDELKSPKEIEWGNGLFEFIRQQLPILNYRSVREYSKLFILRYTTMPAIIVEYGFLTNSEDAINLKNEAILSELGRLTYLYIEQALGQ